MFVPARLCVCTHVCMKQLNLNLSQPLVVSTDIDDIATTISQEALQFFAYIGHLDNTTLWQILVTHDLHGLAKICLTFYHPKQY